MYKEREWATLVDENQVQDFQSSLRGRLIRPTDGDYDEVRSLYNAMIDKYPAFIVRCANVADVIQSVNFARANKLLLAIRGGGHNGPGLGSCDNGLVIDLSEMKGIRVDPTAKTVRAEGGCTWGDVDHATHAFGMVTPSGIISTTGVGGLTLGGGLGHLARTCGLTLDNLLSVDMVLADGRFVTASAEENQDLFWAVRGGGGNFGVVTSFLFRLHEISTVYAGPMLWELDQAAEAMRFYRDYIITAPEEMNGWFAFLRVPPAAPFPEHLHNKQMCGVVWCYAGPLEKAEEVFAPIRSFGPPALDFVGPLPQPALQAMFDGLYPPGLQWYWRADWIKDLSEEAIAEHVKHGSQIPTLQSTMHLYPISGAPQRVGKNDTAFSYRDANWGMVIAGVDSDPAHKEQTIAWAKAYSEAIHPHSAGGAYINMIMDEGQERVKAAYRDNYARLVEIKTKYDPYNLFRVNQNIQPAGWRLETT
ncbi:MAG: FAD-binding oxidoreductase [Chloroflexi bacterium]|nr:FAD-binding oxidoreductase [Chloroflexota bacterium]MCC6895475.1 FAD-binding oxidoreductase [Anaerolineae bacterium]